MIFRTADEIADEIRMTRSQYPGVFLVVEGREDRLLLQKFISSAACTIEVAEGKDNVCRVIAILDEDDFDGALGIIDADFDRIEGVPNRGSNLIMPECHDMTAMLVRTPALDGTLVEFGSRPKLKAFGEDLLEALIDRALPLGYLRLYSLREELALRFSGLNYSEWIDVSSFMASVDTLIEAVKNLSQRHDLSSVVLNEVVAELGGAWHDPKEVCSGTDLVEILSIGLRRVLGNNNAGQANVERLKSSLRLAFSEHCFSLSDLRREIVEWQDANEGFQVLN